MPQLTAIHRFPVKGLGPDRLDFIEVSAGQTLPHDRAWAIENGPSPFDPQAPGHVKKKHFLMLAGQAELARVACAFDAHSCEFRCNFPEGKAISVTLDRPETHAPLFAHLEDLLGEQVRGPLRMVHAPGQAMTDIPQKQISLINLASVRDLEAKTGHAIDPLRFRGNLLIDGLPAWSEIAWVGQTIRVGEIRMRAESRIGRCAATSVNLDTGERDIDLPKALFEHYGHTQCGVYLTVLDAGELRCGDPVSLDA
ncbi:MAG: MOSC domain-containing protein [Alphaproteobacteria bacterium]|uniref:MOSC domain-containing protein n=1 Tax=Maricaulis alexandrii TaxID=2570354 RepID=UPI001108FBB7|nr:MOSC domain-containing protein [Maricaulis alexandrii]MCR9266342.1 MOSC domain-containing protein [Alphaproteobacteria bacterium]